MNLSDVHQLTIVGAGTMGAGIGLSFAMAGFDVRLMDIQEAQLDQARANHAIFSQRNENKVNADSQLQRFYSAVLPVDLAGARSISSPFLVMLAEDTNLVLERQTSLPEKERGSVLARLRTTMVLAGEYEDIRQFIYELETAPEFILIEEVILSQGDESEEALVLTLGVSTYYWAGPDTVS